MSTSHYLAPQLADLHRTNLLADAAKQHRVRQVRAQDSTPRPAGPSRLSPRYLVLIAAVSAIVGACIAGPIAGTAVAARLHDATSTQAPAELVAYVTAAPGAHGTPVPDFRFRPTYHWT
jgi:hypothetical protein